MLASTWFDLVVWVDVHFQMVPMPAPTPVPFPHPFVGLVFDPAGLVMEAGVGAMMELAGAPAAAPVGKVLINGFPATVSGDNVTNAMVLPHFVIPPGVAWAPVPRPPMPKVGAKGKPPKPAVPVVPPGDALLLNGAQTTQMMGANPVRLGELAMSCSDPVRLFSSSVLAIPKGPPVMIGGPPATNWGLAQGRLLQGAAGRLVRNRWTAGKLHKLVSRLAPERLRNLLHKSVCFLTGHPVDVANGRVLTELPGFALPGLLPLSWQPEYSSSWAHRRGTLGFGWSHPFEQAIWPELGRVVYQAEDGREIEFSLLDLPEARIPAGGEVHDPVNRLTLRSLRGQTTDGATWEVETHSGVRHRFGPVPGDRDPRERAGLARILSSEARDGSRHRYQYEDGRLFSVTDQVNRTVRLEYDLRGFLDRVFLPDPRDPGGFVLHARFSFSTGGDLVEMLDPLGNSVRLTYGGRHLLVCETNRNGLSFHFGYDGTDSAARCVRTWGDGGIYDHQIDYVPESRLTIVADSLGATTAYHTDALGAVVRIVDPFGGERSFEYDDDLRTVLERDEVGAETRFAYDDRGNLVRVVDALGNETSAEYSAANDLVRAVSVVGAEWRWQYDRRGRPVAEVDPEGVLTRYEYDETTGRLVAISEPGVGRGLTIGYDRDGNATRIDENGRRWSRRFDRHGNLVEETTPTGLTTKLTWDRGGRVVAIDNELDQQRFAYDPEGNLIASQANGVSTWYRYGGFDWLIGRREGTEGFAEVTFDHDTEGRLVTIRNEIGEPYRYVLDLKGDVVEEVGFDGLRRRYKRDQAGRVVEMTSPSGAKTKYAHDLLGRVVGIVRPEGPETFAWRADGALMEAVNPTIRVAFERDLLGRVTKEFQGDEWVEYRHAPGRASPSRMLTSRGLEVEYEENVDGSTRSLRARMGQFSAVEIGFERDVMGAEIRRRLPGGAVFETIRDRAGRPTHNRLLPSPAPATGHQSAHERSYEWKFERRLTATVDSTLGRTIYTHDSRGRLAMAEYSSGERQYRVPDAVGNVYRAADRTDRRYGPGGRLLEASGKVLTYDADGNVVTRESSEGIVRFGRLSTAHLENVDLPNRRFVEFGYDALDRRVSKSVDGATTRFIWSGDTLAHECSVCEVQGHVNAAGTWIPLLQLTGEAGKCVGLLCDQVGAPLAATDERGQVRWWGSLDAYGAPTIAMPEDLPWRWPGQYADRESALYYNRFRYYADDLGCYLSPDPILPSAGFAAYAYVNDPLRLIDFFGLGPLLPGEGRVGTFEELLKQGTVGDNLTPHHVPSDKFMSATTAGYSRRKGISIFLEQFEVGGRHRRTTTYGRPPNIALHPRTALARDVLDLKRIYRGEGLYSQQIRKSLIELIAHNRAAFPDAFSRSKGCSK